MSLATKNNNYIDYNDFLCQILEEHGLSHGYHYLDDWLDEHIIFIKDTLKIKPFLHRLFRKYNYDFVPIAYFSVEPKINDLGVSHIDVDEYPCITILNDEYQEVLKKISQKLIEYCKEHNNSRIKVAQKTKDIILGVS